MDLSFLPKRIFTAISLCDLDKLCELRLRVGFPIILFLDGKKNYLCKNGLTFFENKVIIVEQKDIDEIIRNVTEYSTYAYNEKIKKGYITTKDGIRIGLAGECVFENGKIITIKNFTSLNIRIPHEILGCANIILPYLINNCSILNTLIISPPFSIKGIVTALITVSASQLSFIIPALSLIFMFTNSSSLPKPALLISNTI
jgi:stage III sporulation protein AA